MLSGAFSWYGQEGQRGALGEEVNDTFMAINKQLSSSLARSRLNLALMASEMRMLMDQLTNEVYAGFDPDLCLRLTNWTFPGFFGED